MPRRRETGLLEDLFDLLEMIFRVVPPWVSIPVAIVGFFAILLIIPSFTGSLESLNFFKLIFGCIFAMVCLAAGLKGWMVRRRQQAFLTEHVDMAWVNKLSWRAFEQQVAEVYRQRGYLVDETGGGGADGGVDLILHRDGQKTIVQCKRWRTYKVGVKLIRELYGVMTAERADRAIFISSGIYTNEALQFAEGKPLELVDGAQFAEMMRLFQKNLGHALGKTTATGEVPPVQTETPARPECPVCGSPMVLRRAKRGQNAGNEFWGCSKYPACRGIRNLT